MDSKSTNNGRYIFLFFRCFGRRNQEPSQCSHVPSAALRIEI